MSNRLLPVYEDDVELRALCVCSTQLSKLGYMGQWRVLVYLVSRYIGVQYFITNTPAGAGQGVAK